MVHNTGRISEPILCLCTEFSVSRGLILILHIVVIQDYNGPEQSEG